MVNRMGFRFPLAAIILIVISFVFFIIWAVMSFVLNVFKEVFTGTVGTLDATGQIMITSEANLLTDAFGIISLVLFIAGILVVFFFDTFKEEQDVVYYE
jgi:type II secretory pathway component PulF